MIRIGDGPLRRALESLGPDPRAEAIIRGLLEGKAPEEIRAAVIRLTRTPRKAA